MATDPSARFPEPRGVWRVQPDPPSERRSSIPPESQRAPNLRLHLLLFCLTLMSMQYMAMTGTASMVPKGHSALGYAAYQSVSLLSILLVHELGHYIAARIHRVPASPPYFLPLPYLTMFGTLGAVITMNDRIRSRKALLDIGAAGPLAGMVVALPVLYFGLKLSPVTPRDSAGFMQEGQSILYWAMKRLALGPIPPDHDVQLHPMAFAGWGGLLLTMINLLPWGQLDGGHIAFALFGEHQHRFGRWFRRAVLLVFLYNFCVFVVPVLLHRSAQPLGFAIASSMFWLSWYGVTFAMARFAGADHPPFEPAPLDLGRKLVAIGCLILFVLLFLPTPIALY